MKIESVSAAAALRISAIVIGLIVALRFLWVAHAIFIVTFLGVLIGLALSSAVDRLERVGVRRGIGAPVVLLVIVGIVVGIGALIGPSIRDQTRELSRELPKALQSIERWIDRSPAVALVAPEAATPQQGQGQKKQEGGLQAQLTKELRSATRFLFPIISSIFGAIAGVVIVLFIAMYIATTPGVYREGILHLVPHRNRGRAEEWLDTLRDTLRQWLIARLMAMVIVGLIIGGALAALGVKAAAALGVLAALLEFVPFFGPVASAVPAIGVALVDSPQKAIWVTGLYLVVQQLEGNVITPLLLEKRLDIPPVLTVVTVASLGVVFGVIGMLIAEPLLAVVLVTTKMLYVNNVVGDDVKVGRDDD